MLVEVVVVVVVEEEEEVLDDDDDEDEVVEDGSLLAVHEMDTSSRCEQSCTPQPL